MTAPRSQGDSSVPAQAPRAPREGPDLSRRFALTIQEATNALGVSERHVRAHLGEIPHFYLGNRLLIPVDAARDWLREQAKANDAQHAHDIDGLLDGLHET